MALEHVVEPCLVKLAVNVACEDEAATRLGLEPLPKNLKPTVRGCVAVELQSMAVERPRSHIDQGANFPDSGTAVNPMRQFKWTGQQQVYRDNPRELWRANPQQLNSAGHSDGSLGDMSSAPDLGGAVGFDARGRTQPGS